MLQQTSLPVTTYYHGFKGQHISEFTVVLLFDVQFTLCHVLKGNKPDFHNALTSEQSEPMYKEFLKLLGSMHRAEAIKGEQD